MESRKSKNEISHLFLRGKKVKNKQHLDNNMLILFNLLLYQIYITVQVQ